MLNAKIQVDYMYHYVGFTLSGLLFCNRYG